MTKPWDPASYGKSWADQYDHLFAHREAIDLIIEFITAFQGQRRILEFGIGTGRVAIPLAANGFTVAGIDASSEMLDMLQSKTGSDGIDVALGPFESVNLHTVFDVVLLNFSSIFLLPDQAAQIDCFRNAARHLVTGGVFIVEAFVPDHTRWVRGQSLSVSNIDLTSVDILAATHDRAAQTITSQHVIIDEAGIRLRPTSYRYAWPPELDLMGRLTGLDPAGRWARWDRSPFTAASDMHVSIYRKA